MDNAVADAVRRVRRRSAGWWRGEVRDGQYAGAADAARAAGGAGAAGVAGAGPTRADVVAGLVGRLAVAGQALEGRALPHRTPPRPIRDAVLADQLVVVGRDLVAALRATGDADAATTALADVERTVHAVDPR